MPPPRRRDRARGENQTRIGLDAAISLDIRKGIVTVAVDDALSKLEALDERQAKIVEMKFFAGMTIEEIGEVLDISPATVKREWTSAKLLLSRMLGD